MQMAQIYNMVIELEIMSLNEMVKELERLGEQLEMLKPTVTVPFDIDDDGYIK